MDKSAIYMDTIIASNLSSRAKLLLICLISQQKNGNCQICQHELSRLTSTSIRHLSRIINNLKQGKLLRIIRRSGRCHTYILPRYFLQKNQLVADWSGKKNKKNHQDNRREKGKEWNNPELIQAWQSIFSQKYQPVTQKEQKAMDYMIFAHNSGKLGMVKSPVGYLATIARNGHPVDFPSFFERQKSKQNQEVTTKKEEEKEQDKIDQKWHIYTNLPKLQQKKIKNKFKVNFLSTQPRQVVDIFDQKGFQHQIINALFRTYVSRHV